jgi:hypothetical protein
MEDAAKIKTAIESSNSIGLFINDNPDKDTIGAVLAVFFALKNIGKNPFLLNRNSLSVINDLIPQSSRKRVMFSFLGDASEIFYERLPDRTNIYVTPKDNKITPNSFFCETASDKKEMLPGGDKPFDLLITLGVHDYKIIEKGFEENPDALFECDIINIDNNISNQNYGDINFVEDYPTLSQTAACFINRIGNTYENKDVRDALLFGLYNSPANNKSKINFATFKWLIDNGGTFDLIYQNEKNPNPDLRVMEDSVRNIDKFFLAQSGIGLSVLGESLFLSSGATSKNLSFTFEKMKNFFHLGSFVLLWKDATDSIKGIFYSNNPTLTEEIKTHYKGSFKENSGIFLVPVSDILKAKEEIISRFPENSF